MLYLVCVKLESMQGIFSGNLHQLLEQTRVEGWNGCLKLVSHSLLPPLFLDLEGGVVQSIFFRSEVILSFPPEIDALQSWKYQLMTDMKQIVAEKIDSMKDSETNSETAAPVIQIEKGRVIGGTTGARNLLQSELDYLIHFSEKLKPITKESSLLGYVISTSTSNVVVKFTALSDSTSPYLKGEIIESSNALFYGDELFSSEIV